MQRLSLNFKKRIWIELFSKETNLNKSFKKKNGKQFNFIHNDFMFLTLLQIFIFKIFVLTQGIYFFLFPQLFFQKKMNVNSQF